jgi:hypothetical protein
LHSGLRPLSPWGEGYCKECHFIIGLDHQGRLEVHNRGIQAYGTPPQCKGSYKKPPKVTPYSSRKAAFTTKSPDAWCPRCKQHVPTTWQGGGHVYARHTFPPVRGIIRATPCPLNLTLVVKIKPGPPDSEADPFR